MYSAVRGWLIAAAALLVFWKGPEITWGAPTILTDCPSPWLLKHSAFAPVLPAGANFTGYCNFTIGSAQPEIVRGTKIDWTARPVHETYTTSEQWATDNLTVTTTITILNISQDNSGVYQATITNKCGSESCKLILYVPGPCEYEPPSPRNATRLSIVVPESPLLSMHVDYTGDTDPNHYNIGWQRRSHGNLVQGKYHTTHTRLADCAFSSTLTISNASYSESGNYTALPYGLYSSTNDSRTNVTIDLRVIPWPVVTEHPGESVELHSSSVLTYRISNYTQYVRVLFTRNGTLIDPGYNVTVSPSGDVPRNASVSLMISNGQTGDYRMCIGFVSAVNTSSGTQCTVSTTVTRGTAKQAQGKLVLLEAVSGGGGGCLLLVIVFVAAAIAYKRRRRSSYGAISVNDEIERDGPTSKVQDLLQRCVEKSFDDLEFDSIAQGMLQCAALCPETLAVHLGNTGACSEVRYRNGNNLRAVYCGVLKAWFDDIPYMEPAIETRRRLVRIIFKLEVFELAEAIALKTYTKI